MAGNGDLAIMQQLGPKPLLTPKFLLEATCRQEKVQRSMVCIGTKAFDCLLGHAAAQPRVGVQGPHHKRVVGHGQDVAFVPDALHHVLTNQVILAHHLHHI